MGNSQKKTWPVFTESSFHMLSDCFPYSCSKNSELFQNTIDHGLTLENVRRLTETYLSDVYFGQDVIELII